MKIRSIISIVLHATLLLLNLLVLWLSLGWKVRKARKAFEKELIKIGMAKKDAKKLSKCYSKLKKELMNTVKFSAFRWR